MKALTTVLIKVLVREFYREHAVFFLMVVGLAFGFMSKVEHMFLAEFFISMPVVTLIPVGLWVVYTARIVSFNARILRQDENGFSLQPDFRFSPFAYSGAGRNCAGANTARIGIRHIPAGNSLFQ